MRILHVCVLRLSLESVRAVSNASVFFTSRKLPHAQFCQISFITLVDLVHGKILGAHHLVAVLHIERVIFHVGNNRTAVMGAHPELFGWRLIVCVRKALPDARSVHDVIDEPQARIIPAN